MADQSKRLMSLFASPTRAGGTYFSGSTSEAITIEPGSRVTLVKSSKVASNGSEIWSLLVDPPGSRDGRRVYEATSDRSVIELEPCPGFASEEIPF